MKKYRLIYQRLAQKDLVDIFEYIKADNPAAAHKLLDLFDQRLSRLTVFPQSGTIPRDEYLKAKGYRIVIVGEYLIIYLVSWTTIKVRRVIQGRRDYSFLL